MSLRSAEKDLEKFLDKCVYKILYKRDITIREKDKSASLKVVKINVDSNFLEPVIEFITSPKTTMKIMQSKKQCDGNMVVETDEGKVFCILCELKTTLYDDEILYDTRKKNKSTAKGQIKSTLVYLWMILRFLELEPKFSAIVFYMKDKRSKTLPPTDIDPYLQKETDIDGGCWDLDLPNDRKLTVKYKLVHANNDQTFYLSSILP